MLAGAEHLRLLTSIVMCATSAATRNIAHSRITRASGAEDGPLRRLGLEAAPGGVPGRRPPKALTLTLHAAQVRSVPVQTRRIALESLRVRQPRTDRVTSVEASMRLDAVASAGFRMSRSKLLDLVKAGDIR